MRRPRRSRAPAARDARRACPRRASHRRRASRSRSRPARRSSTTRASQRCSACMPARDASVMPVSVAAASRTPAPVAVAAVDDRGRRRTCLVERVVVRRSVSIQIASRGTRCSSRSRTTSSPCRAVSRQCTWRIGSPGRYSRTPRYSGPCPRRGSVLGRGLARGREVDERQRAERDRPAAAPAWSRPPGGGGAVRRRRTAPPNGARPTRCAPRLGEARPAPSRPTRARPAGRCRRRRSRRRGARRGATTPQRTARPRLHDRELDRASRPLAASRPAPRARRSSPRSAEQRHRDPGDDACRAGAPRGRRASPPARSCRSRTGPRPRGSSPPRAAAGASVSRSRATCSGTGTVASRCSIAARAAAGPPWVVTIRWASAGTASAFTSSGSAWSRSCAIARACAHRTSATEERGDAPSATSGAERVAVTSSTAYRTTASSTYTARTARLRLEHVVGLTTPLRGRRAGVARAAAARRRPRSRGRGTRPGPTARTGRAGPPAADRSRAARPGSRSRSRRRARAAGA